MQIAADPMAVKKLIEATDPSFVKKISDLNWSSYLYFIIIFININLNALYLITAATYIFFIQSPRVNAFSQFILIFSIINIVPGTGYFLLLVKSIFDDELKANWNDVIFNTLVFALYIYWYPQTLKKHMEY